jgi:hypothetical protein
MLISCNIDYGGRTWEKIVEEVDANVEAGYVVDSMYVS